MKSLFTPFAGALAVALISHSVLAQAFFGPDAGPYFRVEGGGALTQDGRVTEFNGFAAGNKISYDAGMAVAAAIGYKFNKYLSAELESGFIGNELDRVEGFNFHDTFLYNVPLLANLTLECPIPRTIITPYVGAGVGGAFTVFDADYFSNGRVTLYGSEDDFVFAYGFFAGVRFDLNERMSLGVRYQYFATDDVTFSYDSAFGGPDLHLGIEGVRSHVITVSFNFKF
jgi:opacity protein-like surface antigen